MYKLAWHLDFHSHKNIRINHDPDTAAMARVLRECQIEEIITFAKGHNGFAYYPTKVGTPHPRMKGDAFGDVLKACTAEGVRVLPYASFGIDGEAGRKHNEWAQVFANGPQLTDDWYISLCPFTPYYEELMLPMIEEILEAYTIDGFWFDTMGAMGICYCEWCQREFRETHGLEIPREPGDANWGVYGQFRHDRGERLVADVGRFICERKPDAKVGFNQLGTVRHPERMPEGISCLTLDFTTSGPQSLQASLCSAYGSTADRPADIMSTIFNQGWGDWTPRPFAGLEQEAVAVWARKCRPYLGDRLHPANRLDPISVRAMRFTSGIQEQMAAVYPEDDSKLAPDALLLHGPGAMYGEDLRSFAIHRDGLLPLVGAHRLMLDAGANFAVAAECFLRDHIGDCQLVVLPQMPAIDAATEGVLRDYVEKGGKLLVVGGVPNVNGRPLDWLGISRDDSPWQDHIYLPLWETPEEKSPVLVRGDFHKLGASEAETVLPAIRPYDCDHGVRFGWGIGPASDEPSEFPALVRRQMGQGEIWYLEAPVFTDYEENANWTQIDWFRELLRRIVPEQTARVVSDAGSVEVVVHANQNTTWAFLINHGGEQLTRGRAWSRTFAPVPPFAIRLEIRVPSGRTPASVTWAGEAVPWCLAGESLVIEQNLDAIWRVFRVDWR